MHHIDRVFFDLSNGRHTAVNLFFGLPVVTLTTVGAKSGLKRSVPLIGIPDGDRIVVIASNWGQERHPSWYHNLIANPRVQLAIEQTERDYTAREATGKEYDDYWARAVSIYGGYDAYKKRTGGRRIPIVVLAPVVDDA
jgi:deazaflavin-dependent oxidoreductase (nitroreductase family)